MDVSPVFFDICQPGVLLSKQTFYQKDLLTLMSKLFMSAAWL